MERVTLQTPRRQPCQKGCGFSSSPATNNFSSMCFSDYYLINERTKLPRITLKSSNNSHPRGLSDHLVRLLSSDDGDSDSASDLKNKSCECFCENKVGSFGSRCRCGGRFCAVHWLPKKHACKYEKKTAGREGLTDFLKENIKPATLHY
ncbi:hypothetical protein L2E82_07160 [Cichorium intybus]|uniref:Uncharacterized protein n=1 Tax=Cichorium intybus TaxID=13427 RepID=A0ACB9G4X8_CICIN|nr:hypothetical protein L2E82_07160 [Cichorium intybus]